MTPPRSTNPPTTIPTIAPVERPFSGDNATESVNYASPELAMTVTPPTELGADSKVPPHGNETKATVLIELPAMA